ncbi:hypothetical protein AB0B28_09850 [Glycomyces sp. NPDC046736]|uniref:SCO7613 C-terminal domain-containing membrane protein n=1 Tax=Glycomyces sp. NPDC046736 TaxID=3155615 RepID=UPI0033CE912C
MNQTQTPAPAAPAPPDLQRRGEVTTKSIQIVLLGLGGLLLTAGIIVFTAVAWRDLGDGGRLAILAGATGLLLAVPLALTRFRLWATAETLAAVAVLAMWCSALAGYYLYLPAGAGLTALSVARWTALVLVAAVLYRLAARVSSPGWALLPIAATGAAFAAFGGPVEAALHMAAIGAVLAGAAWTVGAAPTRHTASDRWAAKLLLAAGIAIAFLAGLRAAFGLDAALLPTAAAVACLIAAVLLLATAHARGAGAPVATVAILGSASAAMCLTAWILAARSSELLLTVPAFALVAVGIAIAAAWTDPGGTDWLPPTAAAAVATTSVATLAAVVTGASALASYAGAAALTLLLAFTFPAPLSAHLKRAAFTVGAAVLTWCAGIGLAAFPAAFGAEPHRFLDWEAAAVTALCAIGVLAVGRGARRDYLLMVAAATALVAGPLAGRPWAPAAAFALITLAALTIGLTSPSAWRRTGAWIALYPWTIATALAANYDPAANTVDVTATALVAAIAGSALFVLALRTNSAGRYGAHAVVGMSLIWLVADVGAFGASLAAPLGFTAYALALAAAALLTPQWRVVYATTSCAAAIVAQLLFTAYSGATVVELYTAPPAALLLGLGLWLLKRSPRTGSWAALAPALAAGFGPTLALALGPDGEPWRRITLGAVALAVVLLAANRRWQAPMVIGTIVLAALAVNEIALVWSLVPKWAPLAIGGAILIAAGATLEQRRRDLARMTRSVKAMR